MSPLDFLKRLLLHASLAAFSAWFFLLFAEWLIPGFSLPYVNLIDLSFPVIGLLILGAM